MILNDFEIQKISGF